MQLVLAVLIGLGLTLSIVQEIPAAWQAAFWADSKRLLTAETTDVSSIDSNRTVNAAQPPNGGIPNVPKIVGPQSGLLELGTPGGKLVVPGGTPATLNGLVTEEGGTQNVIFMLHGSLVEPNPVTGVMEPGLAQSWEISEDQRTITFHLRQGVKFSDGVPFSAADVLFTFNDLIFNDDVTNTLKDRLQVNGKRLQFERVDDFTVRVTLAAPFRPILRSLEIAIYPKHKLANQVAKLNPGVRGILRAVQTFLDSHLEALAAVSKTLVEAANRTLQTLNMTVEVRDATQAEVLAGSLDDTLAQLQGTLTEEDALFPLLRNVRALVANVGALATKAQWEGVPPGNFNQAWPSNAPASDIVGLGPFRFVRVDAGQQVVLERNPFYWKVDTAGVQLPYVDQFVFLDVENSDTALLKFETGELDVLGPNAESWSVLADGVRQGDCVQRTYITCQNREKGWQLLRGGNSLRLTFFTLYQDIEDPVLHAVFNERTFRKALARALDKPTIVANVFNGLGAPQWGPLTRVSPFYDRSESFVKYPFDLDEARRLLDEAGLRDTDADGIRNVTDHFLVAHGVTLADLPQTLQDEDRRELAFSLETSGTSSDNLKLSNIYLDDLARVGIKVSLRPIDFGLLVTHILNGQYEMILISLFDSLEPNDNANVWRPSGSLNFWRPSAKDNPLPWEQRVDELLDTAATTFDDEVAVEAYKELQFLITDNLPLIFTTNQEFLFASKADLANTTQFSAIFVNNYFAPMMWWKDATRRLQVETVTPQQ